MGEILTVPFEEKYDARNNGAVFVRGDFFASVPNHWEIPDGTQADIANSLKTKYGESKKTEIDMQEKAEREWAKVLRKRSTIDAAQCLKTYGVPMKEIQRIEMLRLFGNHSDEELHIPWDCLCRYSSDFESKYGPQAVVDLMKANRLGNNIKAELESPHIPQEVKALIEYVIPEM